MYKVIYPTKDATIYEKYSTRNTGVDQILELRKIQSGSSVILDGLETQFSRTYNSRILMQFDISNISDVLHENPTAILVLRATYAEELPFDYELSSYPLKSAWVNGTGYYNNNPEITNGVSWRYKDGSALWEADDATECIYNTVHGGGVWDSTYASSQSFNSAQSPDIRMDVTRVVQYWQDYSNNGLILKYENTIETGSNILGNIQFFSRETHTVYQPRLEFYWNDQVTSGTSSFTEVDITSATIYAKNLKPQYSTQETCRINLGVRKTNPTYTYTTSSYEIQSYRLPVTSYYSVRDEVTAEEIIPFHDYTTISCDASGMYFKMDISSLSPERYYRLMFKSVSNGTTQLFDDGYIFKVTR